MGEIRELVQVKLIVGQIAQTPELFEEAQERLCSKFGAVDYESPIILFSYTDYYEPEMGKALLRKFIAFEKLINPDELVEAKLFTQKIESQMGERKNGNLKRKINLDPGYLNLGKLVLATTKDHQHRLYLRDGIFGEVTLRYKGGTYAGWEWSYPDYRSPEYLNIFHCIREIYRDQIAPANTEISVSTQ